MVIPETDFDIAVIGAGPAGCGCALALSNSGLRVVLVDASVFPRDKVCGDAIPGPTLKALKKLNPEWEARLHDLESKAEVKAARIYTASKKTFTFRWQMLTYNSKRIAFDHFLFELVAADTQTTILQSKRLENLETLPDKVICHFNDGTSLSASVVIGCDGANSIVARKLHAGASRPEPAAAVRIYYKDIAGIDPGVNEFHLFRKLPGYFWIFPLEDGWANVGFGLSAVHAGQSGQNINLRKRLAEIIETEPGIAQRFKNAQAMSDIKGFSLPLWQGMAPVSGLRTMICGDAACLIDPLMGHGIDKAFNSGIMAARQAIACFEKQDFSADFMKAYNQKLNKEIGAQLSGSLTALKTTVRYPWLINLLPIMENYPRLARWAADRLKI